MSQNKEILQRHGMDEGHFESCPPDLVVWPRTKDEVSKIVSMCSEEGIPIIPFGSASGLEGGVNAINGGICLDMTRHMNQVIQVNADDFDCIVEPGLSWRDLNTYLRDTGLWFSVDPGASASLGGMASTGASGTNAVKHGTMKQNVLNLEVVTAPNGSIIKTSGNGTRARKSSAGYNLTELFVGSEGTLGIITQLTLRLKPIPQHISVAVCPFKDTDSAISAAIAILQSGLDGIARIEFLDELSMKASKSYSNITYDVKPTLFFEFHSNCSNDGDIDVVKSIVTSCGSISFTSASDATERAKLWKARHEVYYACKALIPNSHALSTDVCVPISKLSEMISGAQKLLATNKLIGPILGHVGDGNFHSLIIFDGSDEEEKEKVQNVAFDISLLALSLGGTCTGEHGIGRGKMELLRKQFGNESIQTMKLIKSALDPNNIMNPGKLFY